jgi:two-component system, NarL family, nitrate/nitrite response regulator NarL
MAKLGIISSHDIFVAGLRSLLSGAGHEIVSACSTADGLLAMPNCLEPEIIIFSQCSSTSGALRDTIARLQHGRQAPKLVLVLEHPTDASEIASLKVDGIVVSSPHVDQLLECLESVARGRRWVDPDVLAIVFAPQRTDPDSLTSREQQIVEGVVRGLRNKEIAREMKLREGTVKMHLHRVFDKLKLESRTQLVLAFSRAKAPHVEHRVTRNGVVF